MGRKLGCLAMLLALTVPVYAAGRPGSISGRIKNARGVPQMGATVEIISYTSSLVTTAFTDARGFYSVTQLPPGTYDVKATAATFLPTLRESISLRGGSSVVLNLTLETLSDAINLLPAKRGAQEDDDWKWTLRSSANRPILRIKDDTPIVIADVKNDPLKGAVAFIAGAQSDGFSASGDMSTRFAVEKSLFSTGMLSVKGDVGYGDGPSATVLRTAYSHRMPDGSTPEFAVTLRRFAVLPQSAVRDGALEALSASFADNVSVAGVLDLRFGTEFQAVQFMGRAEAFRPFGSADLHLSPNLVLEYQYATSVPNMRMRKGFDSAPADLTESQPRVSMMDNNLVLQKANHQEVSLSRRMGKTSAQVAAYRDRLANAALTGVGNVDPESGWVLPDVYSGTFTYGAGDLNTNGARVVVERKLRDDIAVAADYSYSGTLDLVGPSHTFSNLRAQIAPARRHAVTAKVTGKAPHVGTRWIASYKWTSGEALTPVDLFNVSAGQADPFLNVFIRQPLPAFRFMPGKMEALVDIRNLLAQGYVPLAGSDGTIYLVQSARSVRGGVAFVF